MVRVLASCLVLAACSGEGSSTVDAMPDSPPAPVVALSSCPATVAETILDSPTRFIPNTATIAAGDVIKFEITAEHFVIPNTLVNTDAALMVSRAETKCFRFNTPGTYGFLCGVHSFVGSITVQ